MIGWLPVPDSRIPSILLPVHTLTLAEWQTATLPGAALTPADRRMLARLMGAGMWGVEAGEPHDVLSFAG